MTTNALQIRVGRFDSGPRLHHFSFEINNLAPKGAFCFVTLMRLVLQLSFMASKASVLRNENALCPRFCG